MPAEQSMARQRAFKRAIKVGNVLPRISIIAGKIAMITAGLEKARFLKISF